MRTTLNAFEGWWDESDGNVTEAIFAPIGESSTGVAALLSGEIDYISPIPLQDVPRMKERDGITVHEGVEARVMMFGFALNSEKLALGDDAGKDNPFTDVRVRQAAYEAICKAAASMLTRAGLRAELDTMPVRNYWPELRAGTFDMYLLGWSPGTFDAEHPIHFLAATPNEEKKLGSWNFGKYSHARVDELLPMIQTELDQDKRQGMIDEVTKTLQDEIAYIPMYVQPLIAASKDSIDLTIRTDDFFILRWVTVGGG